MTPSHLCLLYSLTPSVIFFPKGFPEKLEKTLNCLKTFLRLLIVLIVIGKVTKSLSVTNNGFLIFATKQASGRSADLSSPVQIVVG